MLDRMDEKWAQEAWTGPYDLSHPLYSAFVPSQDFSSDEHVDGRDADVSILINMGQHAMIELTEYNAAIVLEPDDVVFFRANTVRHRIFQHPAYEGAPGSDRFAITAFYRELLQRRMQPGEPDVWYMIAEAAREYGSADCARRARIAGSVRRSRERRANGVNTPTPGDEGEHGNAGQAMPTDEAEPRSESAEPQQRARARARSSRGRAAAGTQQSTVEGARSDRSATASARSLQETAADAQAADASRATRARKRGHQSMQRPEATTAAHDEAGTSRSSLASDGVQERPKRARRAPARFSTG